MKEPTGAVFTLSPDQYVISDMEDSFGDLPIFCELAEAIEYRREAVNDLIEDGAETTEADYPIVPVWYGSPLEEPSPTEASAPSTEEHEK